MCFLEEYLTYRAGVEVVDDVRENRKFWDEMG